MNLRISGSKRLALKVGLGLLGVALGVVGLAHDSEHYRAEIRRTSGGIPHIKADKYGSLGYGLGYAFATDNHCMFANHLTTMQVEDLGIDYTDKRNGLFEAITLEDAQRVAKRLLAPGKMLVTLAGRPEGF